MFQEIINVFDIIKGIILEKLQVGNDPELVPFQGAQLVTDLTPLVPIFSISPSFPFGANRLT